MTLTHPSPRVRGRFITRMEEKPLGRAVLDAATAEVMGREQLGWFIGGHTASVHRAAEQFGRLDANPEGGVWVVVPHSRELARELFANWPHADLASERPSDSNAAWRSQKVWVAVPEDLKQFIPLARTLQPSLAGVIILDPPCVMYRSRAGTDSWGNVHRNDRPQHIVNFRAALAVDGWQPPLLFLTTKAAKSVNTEVVARVFCLAGFRFIAGDSFGCWDEPINEE